jgi:hypothetical protein
MNPFTDCYYYKQITLNNRKNILTNVAILLTMNNKTEEDENIKHIIDKVPSKRLFIQFNKGFQNCDKKHLIKQQSNYDLCDATKTALLYAFEDLNEEHVLILEDDAYFVKNIEKDITQIKSFLKKADYLVYNLGAACFIANPFTIIFNKKHIHVKRYSLSHACVYNKRSLKSFDIKKCEHVDLYSEYFDNCYVYHRPLVLQLLHKHSSNSKTWPISGKIAFYLINVFGLFKEYPPLVEDFNKLYLFSKLCSVLFLMTLVYIIIDGIFLHQFINS